jgi:hypothetical protein
MNVMITKIAGTVAEPKEWGCAPAACAVVMTCW